MRSDSEWGLKSIRRQLMMSPFKLKQCYGQSRQSNNIFWASDFQFGAFVKKKRWFLVVDWAVATIPIRLRSDHVSSESLLSVAGWNTRASFETIKFFFLVNLWQIILRWFLFLSRQLQTCRRGSVRTTYPFLMKYLTL